MAYYHVVFTTAAEVNEIACLNKAVVYDILFKAASEALLTIGKPQPQRTRAFVQKYDIPSRP